MRRLTKSPKADSNPCNALGVPLPVICRITREREGAAVYTQPFVDVGVAAQVRATHPPGFIGMSKTAFGNRRAVVQGPPTDASYASAIRIHRLLGRRILFPVSTNPVLRRSCGSTSSWCDCCDIPYPRSAVLSSTSPTAWIPIGLVQTPLSEVVSPLSAPHTFMATSASVSRSTVCSAL